MAADGKRLAELFGHLPGYWIHPSLVVATFEKNATKWSGNTTVCGYAYCCALHQATLIPFAAGEPTDRLVKVRGIKTTKKLKAGGLIRPVIMFVQAFETLENALVIEMRLWKIYRNSH